jgi:hypothetical protein
MVVLKVRAPYPQVTMSSVGYGDRVPATTAEKIYATVRAALGRLSALSVPQPFPMEIHLVWSFCMGAQGA